MSCSFAQPYIRGFEAEKSTGMILIDLQKLFASTDHNILLNKMKYLGITSKAIDWLVLTLKSKTLL